MKSDINFYAWILIHSDRAFAFCGDQTLRLLWYSCKSYGIYGILIAG